MRAPQALETAELVVLLEEEGLPWVVDHQVGEGHLAVALPLAKAEARQAAEDRQEAVAFRDFSRSKLLCTFRQWDGATIAQRTWPRNVERAGMAFPILASAG